MRILFLASSPDDESRLRLDREHKAIQRRLAEARGAPASAAGGTVPPPVLEAEWAVQPKDLIRSLLESHGGERDASAAHPSGSGPCRKGGGAKARPTTDAAR